MFYTYLWLREDGTPYYIGKGRGNRAYHNDKYRSVKRPKYDSRILVQNWGSEEEAFSMEKFWISLFGRLDIGTGILRNRTSGGDGPTGATRSSATVDKLSKRMLGSKLRLGAVLTTESKSQISSKVKALWSDPVYREHMRQVHKGQGKGRSLSEHTKDLCRKNHNPESNKNLEKHNALRKQSTGSILQHP
jgi:hypothetical protein